MAEFDMHEALHDAQMLAEKRHSEIMRLQRVNYDLLVALEETFQGYLDTEYYGEETVQRARAAIARAKGEGAQ